MADIERTTITPAACVYHDSEEYTIELDLPGVNKDDITLEMSEQTACLKATRDNIEYFRCWVLAHAVNPKETEATFKNGLLTVTAPLAKSFEGVKVSIE